MNDLIGWLVRSAKKNSAIIFLSQGKNIENVEQFYLRVIPLKRDEQGLTIIGSENHLRNVLTEELLKSDLSEVKQ